MTYSPLRALVWGLRGLWAEDRVSDRWLREHDTKDVRAEFHSVQWAWPIDKRRNESGLWNRHRLKKRA